MGGGSRCRARRTGEGEWYLPDSVVAAVAGQELTRDQEGVGATLAPSRIPGDDAILWIEANKESDSRRCAPCSRIFPAGASIGRPRGKDVHFDLVLARPVKLRGVGIRWHQAPPARRDLPLETSSDGVTWRKVFDGASSGKSADLETYYFDPHEAGYVRFQVSATRRTVELNRPLPPASSRAVMHEARALRRIEARARQGWERGMPGTEPEEFEARVSLGDLAGNAALTGESACAILSLANMHERRLAMTLLHTQGLHAHRALVVIAIIAILARFCSQSLPGHARTRAQDHLHEQLQADGQRPDDAYQTMTNFSPDARSSSPAPFTYNGYNH